MPTTVSEADDFVAIVQRPNNGELADAASIDQLATPLTKRTRYTYNRSITGKIDARRHGVVGSGAVNDATAINAAIAEAVALGAGEVWLPGGKAYRCDAAIALDGRVALKTMKGYGGSNESRLIRNHAGSLITLNNAFGVSTETPCVIEGFKFSDLSGNANPLIDVLSGSLTLLRCWTDGFTSAGPIIRNSSGPHSWLRVLECHLRVETGQTAILHRIGQLLCVGSLFKAPNSYSSFMIDVDSTSAFDPAIAHLHGNYFDASDQTLGAGGALLAHGSYWTVNAFGNTFQTETQAFTAFTWASSFATARRLVEQGNMFHLTTRHSPNGDPLGEDNEVSLQPKFRRQINSATDTIPTSRRTYICHSLHATPTTFTLPPMLYVGQRLRVIVYNASGGTWGSQVNFPGAILITGVTLPASLNNGQTLVVDLEVADVATAGVYVWTIVRTTA